MGDLEDFAWKALAIVANYLPPDSGVSQDEAFNDLLALIDTHPALIQLVNTRHYHVAGTTAGLGIDTCAKCRRDIRDEIHLRMGERP